jgi:carboxymethylenebutenolidase
MEPALSRILSDALQLAVAHLTTIRHDRYSTRAASRKPPPPPEPASEPRSPHMAFSENQIGRSAVRFPSGIPIPTITDASTDPYAKTRVPKEVHVEGLQFWPQESEKITYPGLILLHDWWGLNAQIERVAVRLAAEGYTVLVPNLYLRQGGMVTARAEVAEGLMSRINAKDLLQDINSCCEFLNTSDHVKRNLHGVVGLGMGGELAVQFACQRKRLRAAVSFYGNPVQGDMLKTLNCPVLYHRPMTDDRITEEDLARFRDAAAAHHKRLTIKCYEKARHAFFDENAKDAYHPEAARDAWDATIQFLNETFKSER